MELLRAHPGARYVLNRCLFLYAKVPLEAYQLTFIIARTRAKYKLMLVFDGGIWLNRLDQKHARSVEVSHTILFPLGVSPKGRSDDEISNEKRVSLAHGTAESFHW